MDHSNFSFDDTGRVISCPAGHSPFKVSYKKKPNASTHTLIPINAKAALILVSVRFKQARKTIFFVTVIKTIDWPCAEPLKSAKNFIDAYRWRAGVEATMSQYDCKRANLRLFLPYGQILFGPDRLG